MDFQMKSNMTATTTTTTGKKAAKGTTVPVDLRRPRFLSQMEREFPEVWNEVGLGDLNEREQLQFATLKSFLPPIEKFNDQFLMLIKADAGGSIEQIYRIAVYRDADAIIFMLGGNAFPVSQKGGDLICGQLKGLIKTETIDAQKKTFAVICSFRSPKIDDTVYSFDVSVQVIKELEGEPVIKEDIDGVIADGNPLVDFLDQKPIRADNMAKLVIDGKGEIVDLPREFAVKAVVYNPANPAKPDLGDGFTIQLVNGLAVYARGNSENILRERQKNGDVMPGQDGQPWKLVISECTPKDAEGLKFNIRNRISPGAATELPVEN